jgi:peptidoglycan/xylan/chitin deacetylase (PgdA/CDA1 family)
VITKVIRWMLIIGVFVTACRPISATDRVAQRIAATASPRSPAKASSPPPPGVPSSPAANAAPVDCAKSKCLALTFDDGPGPYTARLLETLKRHSARATFFVVGRNAAAYPRLLRRMTAENHQIGNHTYDHADLATLSTAGIHREIRRTQQIVHRATGRWPVVVRPPYGATNSKVNHAVGLPEIMWKGDTLDWLHRNSGRVRRSVLKLAGRNAIILVHDIRQTTVAAMPATLNGLIKRGYTLVTVSELFRGKRLRAGHAYGWG